jgi:hypothetical protein
MFFTILPIMVTSGPVKCDMEKSYKVSNRRPTKIFVYAQDVQNV